MTRRELEKAHGDIVTQYEQLRRILVAVVRERGTLRVSKADYDAAGRTWAIALEPVERGAAVEVVAVSTEPRIIPAPGLGILQ